MSGAAVHVLGVLGSHILTAAAAGIATGLTGYFYGKSEAHFAVLLRTQDLGLLPERCPIWQSM